MKNGTITTEGRAGALQVALGAVLLILVLGLFALAGTVDYYDRTEGLGASMVPDPEWRSTQW